MIILVDFGSQTAHLIARRIRDFSIDCSIVDPENILSACKEQMPTGIIFSGGPSSVYDQGAPTIDKKIFHLGIPILGICYGWQLIAHVLGGNVRQGRKEYGPATLTISSECLLFFSVKNRNSTVWMSHGDQVITVPVGFDILASTSDVRAAAVADQKRKIFGVQFHPEVEHTQCGNILLKNFLTEYCCEKVSDKKLSVTDVVAQVKILANAKGRRSRAIAAVSGGVDSAVAAAIVAKAIGDRFIPIYCDNGLMREGTTKEVQEVFTNVLHVHPVIIDCRKRFLDALKGITDPETKRKIIGGLYITIFEEEAQKIGSIDYLVQGTIYSDVIESKGTKNSDKIKSHHNVGGLPEHMKLSLIEPLRHFYKDEVRTLGRQLGLPESVVLKQPFPGPGAAIRIIGEVTKERLARQQQADAIVLEVLKEDGWYEKVFQSFPILTGVNTTAVKGDGRVYGELVGLRIYDSSDIMTAGWTRLPYEILQKISSRIVNEVPGVSRVAYDITTKPPATMEWE